jgi:hypothetical protein
MRYVFGFLCVCVFGVLPMVGCLEWDLECDSCDGVWCPPDENECTTELCSCGSCRSRPVSDGRACDLDGLAGICIDGRCEEDPCEGVVCDDGIECTGGTCDYRDGMCDFTNLCDDGDDCTKDTCDPADGMCDFTTPAEDGIPCAWDEGRLGICEAGACVGPCDPGSNEIYPCPGEPVADYFCCPRREYCIEGDC